MFLQDDLISNLVRALYTVQRKNMSVLFILIFTLFCNVFSSSTVTNVRDTSHELAVLKRDKRWLVWKEGINWVAVNFFYYIFLCIFYEYVGFYQQNANISIVHHILVLIWK